MTPALVALAFGSVGGLVGFIGLTLLQVQPYKAACTCLTGGALCALTVLALYL